MSYTVKVKELHIALPVLQEMAKTKLPILGALKLSSIMAAVDEHLTNTQKARLDKANGLVERDAHGMPITYEMVDEDGVTQRKFKFKSAEAEKEMTDFWLNLLEQEVEIPAKIKIKNLGSDFKLSVEDYRLLGRLLDVEDIPEDTLIN